MIRLASIIETFEAQFLAQYAEAILPSHRRALNAMKACRTALSPRMLAACPDCDHQTLVPHSCGHRHCPHCQHFESQQWLERQLQKRVPATYFLLTFTLPAELRALAWHHQRTVYDLLCRCGWETLRAFSHNDKQLAGTPGAISVLHTHSRRLEYHPHVHLVMPAAAIDPQRKLWRTKRNKQQKGRSGGYLFNHKALAKVFRAKMLDALAREGLALPEHTPNTWVVDCKAVGAGEQALTYLGRYLYRGVIAEKDILSCENGKVTFRYRNAKNKRMQTRTVSGPHFLWLVLQHVLPKGFRRARNFGFLHPNSKRLIALVQYLLGVDAKRSTGPLSKRPQMLCPHCGTTMTILRTRISHRPPVSVPQPVPIG